MNRFALDDPSIPLQSWKTPFLKTIIIDSVLKFPLDDRAADNMIKTPIEILRLGNYQGMHNYLRLLIQLIEIPMLIGESIGL